MRQKLLSERGPVSGHVQKSVKLESNFKIFRFSTVVHSSADVVGQQPNVVSSLTLFFNLLQSALKRFALESSISDWLHGSFDTDGNQLAFFLMGGVEKVICPHNSPLHIKGEAIDIDHRITKQQCTTLFPLNGIWMLERPFIWHAKRSTYTAWAEVVDQLVERSLLTLEVRSSSPVISKKLYLTFTVNCIEETKIKKKRPGMDIFFKSTYTATKAVGVWTDWVIF